MSIAMPRSRRLATVKRGDDSRVVPLELFFDLVFVLALTQCTALMADDPTWAGLARGLLVLGVLWWSWVGFSWLTSVVDPEEGAVRLVMFAAMAAMLVVGLAVLEAFGDAGSSSPPPTWCSASRTSSCTSTRAGTTRACAARSSPSR
jgi:low temperature requirement protein LtrA